MASYLNVDIRRNVNIKDLVMKDDHLKLLNPQHKLFEELKESDPVWWQFIKENIKSGVFYVDIRKNNSLNVYYNGGSLLKVSLSQGKIKGKIHESYLGSSGSKYIDYTLSHLPQDAENIKCRILKRYDNTSESGIKARLIGLADANYIDSEFAFSEIIEKKNRPKWERYSCLSDNSY